MLSAQPPIKMLASVTSVEEALIALHADVDILDLKNPSLGALGALHHALIEDIVKVIDGRRIMSATIGDLPMDADLIVEATEAMLATGVDIVKIGFFGNTLHTDCLDALRSIAAQHKLIAVMFADDNPDFDLLPSIAKAGFYGVMLDTAHKNGSHLLEYITTQQLSVFVAKAKALGLEVGLAGSIQPYHIEKLLSIEPSYLGFRGALCEHSQRTAALVAEKIQDIKKMLASQAQLQA